MSVRKNISQQNFLIIYKIMDSLVKKIYEIMVNKVVDQSYQVTVNDPVNEV